MKKVDIVKPGSLNNIIGPVGTIKRILNNRDFFITRGYDIQVFTNDSFIQKTDENKHIVANKSNFSLKARLRIFAHKSFLLSIMYLLKGNYETKKLIKNYLKLKRHPDIVVFHSYIECYYFLKLCKDKNIKVVMFLHSDGIPYKMEQNYFPKIKDSYWVKYMIKCQQWTAEHVDRIVFIARIGRENFLKYFPTVKQEKTLVILNGIDDLTDDEWKFSETINSDKYKHFKYRLCCVGTINFRKGQRLIVDALSKINKEKLKLIHVTFVGEGPERLILEEWVRKNNIADNVEFVGSIPNNQVYKYLLASNIYILTSNNEGLPISIIEAMRVGLPIISTKVSGIPELVTEDNGVLINPDSKELAEIFTNIDKYNWTRMGECSREKFLNQFTFSRMRDEYCDMLDHLS